LEKIELASTSARWGLGCQAEYDRARRILLHEPGPELLSALLWPEASSYEESFDSRAAANEHKDFQEYLKSQGIAVHLLGDLLAGCPDLDRNVVEAITIRFTNPTSLEPPHEAEEGDEILRTGDLEAAVSALSTSDKIRILLERPTLLIDDTSSPPQFFSMTTDPLSNLYFMRDQLIVTDRGIVLGRFRKAVRQGEQKIVKLALKILDIEALYEVQDPGVLEGGDFIPAGEWGLFGCGPRTNQDAMDQLLCGSGAEALGYDRVAVIKDPEQDPRAQEQEMHLDTYFMLVGPHTCLVEKTRVEDPERRPSVDIYEKSSGEQYTLEQQDVRFDDFLTNELDMIEIIGLSPQDQEQYGLNVLCLKAKSIVGSYRIDQSSSQRKRYEKALASAGIDFKPLMFTNIRKGFGANHCMSHVLLRGVS
jgi:arginine deiminase